ncbi:MAG: FKBP-type peptidyl-prolyl cis-trans isomerase [Gammaproteobacteria bacterium TMED134]|nr:MAG: FKBP-type peptidyl-prolyl cis-trans isomerase [Gammaproteobacteria bacterium TMED134]|tara:strand:- start:104 stop:796 length:693 start_codon:yes stop_codon:yes gene_type:complete
MKWRVIVAAIVSTGMLVACQPEQAVEAPKAQLDTESEVVSASYLIGFLQAQNMSNQSSGVADMQAYSLGVADAVAGEPSQVPLEEQETLMMALSEALMAKKNEAGVVFREQNAARPEVTTLSSGLQYEILVAGDGPMPGPTDTVVTHYHGTLTDDTIFDSSVDRGAPATFQVNQVIAGWTEALQLMSVGSKWRLVIPPELAYGDRGAGGAIPPNATLVFEVELLEIQGAE